MNMAENVFVFFFKKNIKIIIFFLKKNSFLISIHQNNINTYKKLIFLKIKLKLIIKKKTV
jgi:hypothetical protein